MNHIWQQWMREYFPNLQKRHKEIVKRRQFQVSDLVLMCDQPSACAWYPLACIVGTHPDSSEVVRNVTLHAPNTNSKYGDPKFPDEKPVYPTYRWRLKENSTIRVSENIKYIFLVFAHSLPLVDSL